MLKDVRNVRVGLGSLLLILVRSHWLLMPGLSLKALSVGDNTRGT
jgi:hypothetical protein